ncbi:MAG: lamin tail domain-containing protein [archaeon]
MNTIKICFCTLLFLVMFFGSVNAYVVINEVELNPSGADSEIGSEWIELHNDGSEVIELTGWELRSKNGRLILFDSGIISGNEYIVINLPEGKSLTNSEDYVELKDYTSTIVDLTPTLNDTVSSATSGDSRTWQRIPDGDNNWQFLEGTAGASNGGDGGNGGIPEFPAFIVPVLLMFAGVSVARRYGGL